MEMGDGLGFNLRLRETFLGVEGDFSTAKYFLFGVPYDLTSSFRPGSRYGPEIVRKFSANMETNSYRLNFDASSAKIFDGGDVVFSYRLSTMLKRVYRVVKNVVEKGKVPIMIGGEHTFTLAAYLAASNQKTAIVVFDAHFDLRDNYGDLRLNHATYLRRLVEKKPNIFVAVVGVRGYDLAELDFAQKNNITFIKASEVGDISRTSKILKEAVEDRQFYVSVDIDVLDPCYAPGVGNPEPCGMSVEQLIELIHLLGRYDPIGFDLMEVNPLYDNGATAAAASRVLVEFLASTAES